LQVGHLISEKVFVLCAIIIVKRILEPEMASVIPEADQNISFEIFVHIVITDIKITG
jgi:hypothetical protein